MSEPNMKHSENKLNSSCIVSGHRLDGVVSTEQMSYSRVKHVSRNQKEGYFHNGTESWNIFGNSYPAL